MTNWDIMLKLRDARDSMGAWNGVLGILGDLPCGAEDELYEAAQALRDRIDERLKAREMTEKEAV